MKDHPALTTERLTLEPLRLRHAGALHAMYADPRAMRFWHTPPHADEAQTLRDVRAKLRGPGREWAIARRTDGAVIGSIGLLGNPGAPGLGYSLHAAAWGQGYATEALRAVLAYGFTALDLDRVELWIDAGNRASLRLAERTGFTRRGVFLQRFQHREEAHETLVYGLRRDEWAGESAASPLNRVYGLTPVLPVPDVRATIDYYQDVLGFRLDFLVGDPPRHGGVGLGEWMASGAHLQFSQQDGAVSVPGFSLAFDVGGQLERLHDLYRKRGVAVRDIQSQPWGVRAFELHDLNGYRLTFSMPG